MDQKKISVALSPEILKQLEDGKIDEFLKVWQKIYGNERPRKNYA